MLHRLLMAAGGSGGFTVPDMTSLGWINVMDYGAAGNGSTDDTAAVTAAIAAVSSSGGVLYFPPGTYKTTGGFAIDKPCTILGMGGAPANDRTVLADPSGAVSEITCTSTTANLFTVTSFGVGFEGLTLTNTAATTPTAGAGIATAADATPDSGNALRVLNCTIRDFYIGLSIQYGCWWHVSGCFIWDPVYRGIAIRNLNSATGLAGEFTLESSWFITGARTQTTAIAVDYKGGSGGRINGIETLGSWGVGIEIKPDPASPGYFDPVLITGCMLNGIRDVAVNMIAASGKNIHNVLIANTHMNPGNDGITPSYAIVVDASSGGTIDRIMVTNCSMMAETASSGAAIAINTVDRVRVTGCLQGSFSGGVLSQASSTNVTVTASA